MTVCDDTQNLNETESKTFFRYQIFPIPNPIIFPIPNFYDTESDTFFDTKFFQYRIRNHQKNRKVSKPRSFETKTSHSAQEWVVDWKPDSLRLPWSSLLPCGLHSAGESDNKIDIWDEDDDCHRLFKPIICFL